MSSTPRIFIGTVTVRITGTSCRHCLDAVQASVRHVPGIRSVAVDHAADTITVVADRPVERTDVDAAVIRAGHTPSPLR